MKLYIIYTVKCRVTYIYLKKDICLKMTVYVRCIYNMAAHKGGHGHSNQQEAQLMLTTGATRLAVSRGQQHGTIFGPLRLFAKHVIGTTH